MEFSWTHSTEHMPNREIQHLNKIKHAFNTNCPNKCHQTKPSIATEAPNAEFEHSNIPWQTNAPPTNCRNVHTRHPTNNPNNMTYHQLKKHDKIKFAMTIDPLKQCAEQTHSKAQPWTMPTSPQNTPCDETGTRPTQHLMRPNWKCNSMSQHQPLQLSHWISNKYQHKLIQPKMDLQDKTK